MTKLLILGGSDAGITAALRARECDSTSEVSIVLADAFPNYSVCGIPFYLSGEVHDWHQLAHRTTQEITDAGIHLFLNTVAESIDPTRYQVTVAGNETSAQVLSYDRLLIATGAEPTQPSIAGISHPAVFLLRSMEDCFAVDHYATSHQSRTALIIGGGYIGLEMADALTLRGLSVTVVEHAESVLKTVDPRLGALVRAELERHSMQVVPSVQVERMEGVPDQQVRVLGTDGFEQTADLVLVAVGVRPVTGLAHSAGLALGSHSALQVTRRMETTVPDIYAAGDCVETWHRLLNHWTYLPLGTTAHKQGRIAGENAVGGDREFAGTLGTQVVKVFDLVIARTGLRDDEARQAGYTPLTVEATFWDHKVYYPAARPLHILLTGDQKTGQLLGAQMVGSVQGEVAKRIDIFATALFHGMRVEDLNDLDLSYTPPLSSPWDPVQMSAQAWSATR